MTRDAPVEALEHGLGSLLDTLDEAIDTVELELTSQELGEVVRASEGVVEVRGLPGAGSEELVVFEGGALGLVLDLQPEKIGVVLLDHAEALRAGLRVYRTGRILDVPVGRPLLGRAVDPLGRPVDGGGKLAPASRRPVEQDAPPILDRAPVSEPLHTGLTVVDALVPVGRGQRELIVGDRQTGKTSIAIDTILNQRHKDVVCVYCAIGQRSAAVADVVSTLEDRHALGYSTVVVAPGEAPPGQQYVAPFAAMSIAESFMRDGRDVLVVFDDLTRHARAYRELSLLLRRPPGREAFPGDIFYLHSRLLERASHLRETEDGRGGGSITVFPIVETEAQDLSAYIPTNIISITDGQIYTSPELMQKGFMPPVDVGKSVSRVGGKAQLPAHRSVAGKLKLAYAQFGELEVFARFGTRLDEATRRDLEHGRRVRELLKQDRFSPRRPAAQIAVLVAANAGVFDDVPLDDLLDVAAEIEAAVLDAMSTWVTAVEDGAPLDDEARAAITELAERIVAGRTASSRGSDPS